MSTGGGRGRRGQGGDADAPQLGLFAMNDEAPAPDAVVHSAMTQDVGLSLSLSGVRLIEASAGTGKTFTLTTLVLRLLLERGATMADILTVTFTRAATQELRQRIRRRLRVARRLLEALTGGTIDDVQGEAVPTLAVLRAAIAREGGGDAGQARVRERVEAALLQLDEASIATIHGFCHRALREFGFRAGQLAAQTVVDDAGEVWSEVAAELWRAAANAPSADDFAFMTTLWDTPDAMASALKPLCDRTRDIYPRADESPAAAALHALRERALARYEARMDERGQCDQDAVIERVWRATEDEAFASRVATRWPFLLIDEFQDTDPRQWDIFRRLFEAADPARRWLCLIGDPKQAIYRFRGGDLDTYLRAKAYVQAQEKHRDGDEVGSGDDTRAGGAHAHVGAITGAIAELGDNHRSTPAVLRAIETLFTAHALPFIEERVGFHPVRAAGGARDDDLRVDGVPAPGLTLHWLPPAPQDPKAHHSSSLFKGVRGKDDEFALMADAAVHAVAGLLAHGTLRDGERTRALRPADIAILTTTNDQATLMRETLARAGIGAALLSGASVFAGEAAEDLHTVLAGLIEPEAPGRFRAALATALLGCDAVAIARLAQDDGRTGGGVADAGRDAGFERDGDAARERAADAFADALRARFAQAAEHWRTRGPLPALLPFIADAAPRWLREAGGQRRLTDALHLAELLQAESAVRAAPAEQLQWFAQQRAQAARAGRAGVGEDRQLRMEADADAVQISTVHRSKGLEYAVVVLPFVAHRKRDRSQGLDHDDFLDANRRPARAWRCRDLLEPADADVIDLQVEREEQAEAQRQLYVALTRAKHALHVVWSRNDTTGTTALYRLLHGGAVAQLKALPDAAAMRAQAERIADASRGAIVLRPFDPAAPLPRAEATIDASMRTPPARTARRALSAGARLHSFSSLHARGGEPVPERGAIDERQIGADDTVVAPGDDGGLGGTAFGNAVHDVLEATDAAAWRRTPAQMLDEGRWPESERELLERALRRQGLAATPAHLAQTARLVSRALNVPLPGDVRLCDWPSTRLVRELPFHFRLRPLRLETLYAVLDAHGYPRAGRPGGGALEGLMHGYIDLVYRDAHGRHHVLDYKTNRLPAYDPDSLRRAVRVQDYDLQYLIYLVALRRWLRLRHGADYDDARHLGGAVYLFLRGIVLDDGALADGMSGDGRHASSMRSRPGVHVDPVAPAVIAALDACFDGGAHDGGAQA